MIEDAIKANKLTSKKVLKIKETSLSPSSVKSAKEVIPKRAPIERGGRHHGHSCYVAYMS